MPKKKSEALFYYSRGRTEQCCLDNEQYFSKTEILICICDMYCIEWPPLREQTLLCTIGSISLQMTRPNNNNIITLSSTYLMFIEVPKQAWSVHFREINSNGSKSSMSMTRKGSYIEDFGRHFLSLQELQCIWKNCFFLRPERHKLTLFLTEVKKITEYAWEWRWVYLDSTFMWFEEFETSLHYGLIPSHHNSINN